MIIGKPSLNSTQAILLYAAPLQKAFKGMLENSSGWQKFRQSEENTELFHKIRQIDQLRRHYALFE